MNINPTLIMALLLFVFFLFAFYMEISSFSLLPEHLGGMSFWEELKGTWQYSIWFYAMLVSGGILLYLSFLNLKRK